MNKQQYIELAIPVVVPLLVALLKLVWAKIPKQALPIIAPILGALIDACCTGTIGAGTAWGAALGAAGVGLREVYDQLSGNATKTTPPGTTVTPIPPVPPAQKP